MARLLILDTGNASLSMAIILRLQRILKGMHNVSMFPTLNILFSDHLNLENWAQHINMKD